MSTSTHSLESLASSIKVKDCISITLNSEFLDYNFDLIKQCLSKLNLLEAKVDHNNTANKELYDRLNYMQKDTANNSTRIDLQ